MSSRIWLWIGLFAIALGVANVINQGRLEGGYGLGYLVGSLGIGLAIIYFGWYRRRGK